MTTFGTLLPPPFPIDRNLTYLSDDDWKALQQKQLITKHQLQLTREVLNIVKSVPPEIVKTNHLKPVFNKVIELYGRQYLPSGEVKS